jgi:hypothetical protein
MSKKFEKEKDVAAAFLKCKGVVKFDLTKPEGDPPDIIARVDDKFIGIEVTALVSNNAQLILENEYKIIFSRVKEFLRKADVNDLVLRIEPEKNVKLKRDKCIQSIVKICSEKFDQIGDHRTELALNPVSGIKKITAFRSIDSGIIITFDSRKHSFGPLRNHKIKAEIDKKILKLNKAIQANPQFHNTIHENWLLMTVEGTFYANYTEVHDKQVNITLDNCFDKIFVFHKKEDWFEEIKTLHNELH